MTPPGWREGCAHLLSGGGASRGLGELLLKGLLLGVEGVGERLWSEVDSKRNLFASFNAAETSNSGSEGKI